MPHYTIDLSAYEGIPDNACLGVAELARLLNLSASQVYRLEEDGKIPAHNNPYVDQSNSTPTRRVAFGHRPEIRKFWKLGALRKWQTQIQKETIK